MDCTFLGSGFTQIFEQIVSARVKTVSNIILVVSRHIHSKGKELTSVAQERLCSNSQFSPLSSSIFRLRNLLSHSSICNTPPSLSCRYLSFTVRYTYTKRSCFMCGSYLRVFLSSHFVGIIILKVQLLFVLSAILNLSIYRFHLLKKTKSRLNVTWENCR